MALVNDKMAVVSHQVRYLAAAHETLDQSDIQNACRLAKPAADDPDSLRIDIKEGSEAFDSLGEQLAAMDKNERVARSSSDECGGHDGFAEGGCGRQHASIVRRQRLECLHLRIT